MTKQITSSSFVFISMLLCISLLSIFSLSQLNNVRILIDEKNRANLAAEAELFFLKKFSNFERSFVIFSRNLKKTDNEILSNSIKTKFTFLDFIQIFDLTNQRFLQPPILNKQQFLPDGQINIADNPALFTMLETSKIYGFNPIYGPIFYLNEEKYIPTSIYLDHLPTEQLIVVGFININKFENEINKNDSFIFKVLNDHELGTSKLGINIPNYFLSNQLDKKISLEPKSGPVVNFSFYRNLLIFLPIILSLFLLVLMLWNETFKRRKIEKKLSKQILLTEQNSRLVLLGEMIASIAHELNQPLAAISLYSSSLQKKLNDGKTKLSDIKKISDSIIKCSQRAGAIINSTLNLSASKNTVQEKIELNSVFHEIVPILNSIHSDIKSKIKLFIPPNCNIYCNRVAIEQITINLCRNALEEMEKIDASKRVLDIRAYEGNSDEPGKEIIYLEFTNYLSPLKDGLDVKEFSTPFNSNKKDGVGLGLSICKKLVERNGGKIEIFQPSKESITFKLSFLRG